MQTNPSLSELTEQLNQIRKAIEAQTAAKVDQIKQELQELAELTGKSIEQLLGLQNGGAMPNALRMRRPKQEMPYGEKMQRPARYANPADASQTWSGIGRKPAWLRDYLDDGSILEQFLIS